MKRGGAICASRMEAPECMVTNLSIQNGEGFRRTWQRFFHGDDAFRAAGSGEGRGRDHSAPAQRFGEREVVIGGIQRARAEGVARARGALDKAFGRGRFQENMASVFSMETTPSEPPGAERDAAATIAPRRSASGSGRPW